MEAIKQIYYHADPNLSLYVEEMREEKNLHDRGFQ